MDEDLVATPDQQDDSRNLAGGDGVRRRLVHTREVGDLRGDAAGEREDDDERRAEDAGYHVTILASVRRHTRPFGASFHFLRL
jgi:hypothetical protein